MSKLLHAGVVSVAVSFLAPAFAADAAHYHGANNCRIAQLEPAPSGEVDWTGQCKAGFAEGPGTLEWRSASDGKLRLEGTLVRGEVVGDGKLLYKGGKYTGALRQGMPHGVGFFEYADEGGWYEGEVVNGRREGFGIFLGADQSRYDGHWKNGKRHGTGRATFATGGSYDGEWQHGKFDGKGTIVYAGSGHTYEGQFADGRVLGIAPPEVEVGSYPLKREATVGSHIPPQQAVGWHPLKLSWDKLTVGQQNAIRAQYPALEDGDEPPFPVNGTRQLFDAIATINRATGAARGKLRLHVLVGADGTAKNVTAIGSPDPDLTRLASEAAMLQRYKPAVCRGKPCDMIYPLSFDFQRVL